MNLSGFHKKILVEKIEKLEIIEKLEKLEIIKCMSNSKESCKPIINIYLVSTASDCNERE